jgi:DNA-binding protein H-NS
MMNSICLQIIQLWLYIQSLLTEGEEDDLMAERPRSNSESLDMELDNLSAADKISLIGKICDELTVQQLRQVRELAEQKRLEKLEDAKAQVMEEMREKFEQLELDFDEVMGLNRPRRSRRESGSPLPVKYRGPNGETWSGRGMKPIWIRELEDANVDLEEFRVKDEG